jgi:hypothetical protein
MAGHRPSRQPRYRIANHALNAGGSVCLWVLAATGLVPVRPGGSFARRPQEAGNVGIRKYQVGRIDRSGERRIFEPPPKPRSQLKPVEPQRRAQERLEKPLALRRVEPRPGLASSPRSIQRAASREPNAKFSKGKSENEKRKYAEGPEK